MPAGTRQRRGKEAPFVLPDMMNAGWIAGRIRRRRTDLELSQADAVSAIADASGLEMSVATYSRCETGKMELSNGAVYLMGLARGLRCSTTFLLGLTDDPSRWEPEVEWPTDAEEVARLRALDAER